MEVRAVGSKKIKKLKRLKKRAFLTSPESQTLNVGRRREQLVLTANKRQSENSVCPPVAPARSRLVTEHTRALRLVIPGEKIS